MPRWPRSQPARTGCFDAFPPLRLPGRAWIQWGLGSTRALHMANGTAIAAGPDARGQRHVGRLSDDRLGRFVQKRCRIPSRRRRLRFSSGRLDASPQRRSRPGRITRSGPASSSSCGAARLRPLLNGRRCRLSTRWLLCARRARLAVSRRLQTCSKRSTPAIASSPRFALPDSSMTGGGGCVVPGGRFPAMLFAHDRRAPPTTGRHRQLSRRVEAARSPAHQGPELPRPIHPDRW